MRGRILLASAAVLVAVGTALELRAELDYQVAHELFADVLDQGSRVSLDDIDGAREQLERARSYRPGTTALVAQVLLEQTAGNTAEAEALARKATEREPENIVTWQALLSTARDPEVRARAEREILRLDPLRGER